VGGVRQLKIADSQIEDCRDTRSDSLPRLETQRQCAAMNIAVIGTGDIFHKAYAPGLKAYGLAIAAIADLDRARAQAMAVQHGVPRVLSVDELIAAPDIDLVVNLTVPQAHAPIAIRALDAGKHVYGEKPLALDAAEGRAVLAAVRRSGRTLTSAPDTILGAGLQTCRQLVDQGAIGAVVGGCAHFACAGHERWHHNPDFYYRAGGGPVLDMGPYYLSALAMILGPIVRVSGMAARPRAERTIGQGPRAGERVPVSIDTHVAALVAFANGTLVNVVMSFDVRAHQLPRLELWGDAGSLQLSDPNDFGGTVRLHTGADWVDQPLMRPRGRRGAGVADQIAAVAAGRTPRCDSALAFHVLEAMDAILVAAREQRVVTLDSTCARPAPLADGELVPTVS
jgi:predicted dehydrogenase